MDPLALRRRPGGLPGVLCAALGLCWIALPGLGVPGTVAADEVAADEVSPRVLRLFAQSNIYPERFDALVEETPALFDERTLRCVRSLGVRFHRMAQEHLVHCYTIADPFARGQCKSNNPAAVIAGWCVAVLERAEGRKWCETDYGRVSCESKASSDPTRYEQFNQALLGMVQPLIVCP
ncbi:MAG: hypothetical protein ACQGVK_06250 [Myxococcota bacterium]